MEDEEKDVPRPKAKKGRPPSPRKKDINLKRTKEEQKKGESRSSSEESSEQPDAKRPRTEFALPPAQNKFLETQPMLDKKSRSSDS